MKVILLRGKFNSGKTITLRMLNKKLNNFNKALEIGKLNNATITEIEEFDRVTESLLRSSAYKGFYYGDFFNFMEINSYKIGIISYDINSNEFQYKFKLLLSQQPDIIILSVKMKELPGTLYSELRNFFSQISSNNIFEIHIENVNSKIMREKKNEMSTYIFNIVLNLLNGKTIDEAIAINYR